eukprot:gene6353-9279_t
MTQEAIHSRKWAVDLLVTVIPLAEVVEEGSYLAVAAAIVGHRGGQKLNRHIRQSFPAQSLPKGAGGYNETGAEEQEEQEQEQVEEEEQKEEEELEEQEQVEEEEQEQVEEEEQEEQEQEEHEE